MTKTLRELLDNEPLSIHPDSCQDYQLMELHAIESFLSEATKESLRKLKQWAKPDQIKETIISPKISDEQYQKLRQWLIELSEENHANN